MELPKYRCHKIVSAAKIQDIGALNEATSKHQIMLEVDGDHVFMIKSKEWVEKHQPVAGGYYVLYADGYSSFSPAKAFEDGYTLIE